MIESFLDDPLPADIPSRLILVDMSQVSISTIMATFKPHELTTIEETLPLIRHLVFSVLLEKIDKFRKDKDRHMAVLCYDNSRPGGYWRRDIYPSYKDNRSKNRAESEYNFELLYSAMDTVQEELRDYFPFKSISIPRMEADDIIAALTMRFAPLGSEVIILSSDGYFVQLHDAGNVKQWNSIGNKWVQPKEKTAYRDLLVKAFKGDRKDNVAPMSAPHDHYTMEERVRVPPVTAKLLDSYFDSIDNIPEEYRERFEQNMATLDLKAIPPQYIESINKTFDETIIADSRGLYSFMVKNRLSKLIEKIQRF